MDDEAAVRVGQGLWALHIAQRAGQIELPLLAPGVQALAVHELHDEEGPALRRSARRQ